MDQNAFLNHWETATTREIVEALQSNLPITKSFAMFAAVREHMKSHEIAAELKQAENDTDWFWKPYTVSDLAKAALHILGIEKYTGNKAEVLFWIENRMEIEEQPRQRETGANHGE